MRQLDIFIDMFHLQALFGLRQCLAAFVGSFETRKLFDDEIDDDQDDKREAPLASFNLHIKALKKDFHF